MSVGHTKVLAVTLCAIGLAVGAGLLAKRGEGGEGPIPAKADAIDPAVRALAEERVAAARGVYEQGMELYKHAREGSTHDLAEWSRRWLDEQLGVTSDAAERLAAIRAHLDRTRFLEQLAEARKEGARGTYGEVLKARYYRLEAQQRLIEAGGARLLLKGPTPAATAPGGPPPPAPTPRR